MPARNRTPEQKRAERIRYWNSPAGRALEASRKPGRIARLRARRELLLSIIDPLKAGPCMDCGRVWHHAAMEFDHREPGKKVQCVSRIERAGWGEAKLREELAKCDVVCASCHRIRTWTRLQRPVADRCAETASP